MLHEEPVALERICADLSDREEEKENPGVRDLDR